MSTPAPTTPLNLRRRFAAISLTMIAVIALGLGWLMAHVLTERMLQREGEVSLDFIQNLLLTDQSARYFLNPADPELRNRFLGSMAHIASMSEPVRANAYQTDGTVIWSTDNELVGRRYAVNDELDDALRGQLVVHSGRLQGGALDKGEHAGLLAGSGYYVESYIPIVEPGTRKVLGVMELYKVPVQLNSAIREALTLLWLACAGSAAALFAALYWTVARADRVMREQQQRLAESQTLATAVELARGVAHNLRNPLASIRVSAEMLRSADMKPTELIEHSTDITASVDRADRWITELVRVSQAPHLQPEVVMPSAVVSECLNEMAPEMNRRGIRWTVPAEQAPAVLAHTAMLRQILISILANATDAMPQGGDIAVSWSISGDMLAFVVQDSGPGLREDARQALFRPFFSTKSGGLGIGLALVKRMVEQWSGTVRLSQAPVRGTRVELTLPLASGAAPTKEQ